MTGGKLKYWNTGRATLISFLVFAMLGAIQAGLERHWDTSPYSVGFIGGRSLVVGLISMIVATAICLIRNRTIANASTRMQMSTGSAMPSRIEPRFDRISSVPRVGISPAGATNDPLARLKRPRFSNFIARHWRGELPLWVSYWIIGFLGNIVAGAVLLLVDAAAGSRDYDPRIVLGQLLVVWLCICTMVLWQVVGVWRSANERIRERSRMGRNAPWATLAKLAAVLGFLRLGGMLFTTGAPEIAEVSRMAFLDDPDIPAYTLRIMRNGTELEVVGGFKYGLTDDVLRVLRAAPRVRTVHLDSTGGRIGEAEKLYNAIHDHGFITYVANQCMSACTVAFAGGRERWLHSQAKLGFHAPAFPGLSAAELTESIQRQKDIFAASGFDTAFATRALSTPNSRVWTPSIEELLRARVITHVSTGSEFAASGYGANLTRQEAASQFQEKLPILVTLRAVSSKDFDSIIDGFFSGYQEGQTESELIDTARNHLLAVVQADIPLADDAVLVELGRLLVDEYSSLAGKDPSLCYQYASGAVDIDTHNLPAALVERELALYERVLETASQRPALSQQIGDALWARVSAEVRRRVGAQKLGLLTTGNVSAAQYADYCAAAIAFYQEITGLKEADGAALMRQTYGSK
ncbi:hypothetical protein SAMN05519104_0589 [Rhizobiales bacterium GAS188]|nr:hypothetical protein SAMN05519104_0589 [Rhizobiales bacterium GAS188]